MKHQSKTAPLPHRLMKTTSIYLAKQEYVTTPEFTGYIAIILIGENKTLTIKSQEQLSPKHGKIFEFISAQWYATNRSKSEKKIPIIIDIKEIISILGLMQRSENRQDIIKHIQALQFMEVSYVWDNGQILYNCFESFNIIDTTFLLEVTLSPSYDRALANAKERYINVSDVMPIRSSYAIELAKLLQMYGSGLNTRTGKPRLVKELDHEIIENFLHLNDIEESKTVIRRAFKQLEKQISYPRYQYHNRLNLWIKNV